MAYVTARISIQNPPGSVKQGTLGTGFFYGLNLTLNNGTPHSRLLLISNKHVYVDPKRQMTIKVNKKKDDGSPDFGNVASITFHGFADRYYPHPDPAVDLACVDVTPLLAFRVEGRPLYIKHLDDKFLTLSIIIISPGLDSRARTALEHMLESMVSARGKVLRTNFSATSRVTRATKLTQATSRHSYRWCSPPTRGSATTFAVGDGRCVTALKLGVSLFSPKWQRSS